MSKIEEGVPLPANVGRRGRKPKWPFTIMKLYDSVHYGPLESPEHARRAAHNIGHTHGWKFATEAENFGIRIWRVK